MWLIKRISLAIWINVFFCERNKKLILTKTKLTRKNDKEQFLEKKHVYKTTLLVKNSNGQDSLRTVANRAKKAQIDDRPFSTWLSTNIVSSKKTCNTMLHPRSKLMSEQDFSAAVKSLIIYIVEFIALKVKHKRGENTNA